MVQLSQAFDARAVAPQSKPEAIDDGWYPAIISGSDLKPTKAGDGGYLEFVHDIIDGPHKGRKMFNRLNVYNTNQQAVEIALGQLSAICWCTGVFNVSDTSQLHNIPLQIYVVKAKNDRDGGYTNEVKGYRNAQGQEPWKQGGGTAPQQPQQPQQPAAAGWQQPPASGQPPAAGWQPPQQPQQQPAQGPAPAAAAPWGSQPAAAPQQPPQQPPANSGWQPPAQAAPQQPQQAGWQGQPPTAATPPWGQR